MTDMTVANTILEQLGGARFRLMTGANTFVSSEKSLQMKLPRSTQNGATHLKITLNGADLYDMAWMRWNSQTLEMAVIETDEGIYDEMLQDVFTTRTGLFTSLNAR